LVVRIENRAAAKTLKQVTNDTAVKQRKVTPVSPGEMLEEEFLKPLGLTKYRLAKDIGVPAQRIGEIVAGRRAITADTDLRLCRYFGLSDGWWLRGQVAYDTALTREELREELASIQPCSLLTA
jgi:addiction module HigA family antidote